MTYARLLEATNSLSHLDEFVSATMTCWLLKVPFGVYNVTNPGKVTTRECVELIKECKFSNKDFQFFESESEFMTEVAKTHRSNCVMSSEKLAKAGIRMTPVRDAICDALLRWQKA